MSTEYIFINKQDPAKDPTSFASLRSEGIKLSQALSGDIWTDFNTHDPGVTILEQLCFVLTDISYRCDYPVLDYLTDSPKDFTLQASSLIPAEEIFPCHPTTFADLKQLLLALNPLLDNVLIKPLTTNSYSVGLINIYLSISPLAINAITKDQLKQQIYQCYAKNRNLGENINEIIFCEDLPYTLIAEVAIKGAHFAVQTLAEIYINCVKTLQQKITENYNADISVSCFYSAINSIDNVNCVNALKFEGENSYISDAFKACEFNQHIRLNIPESIEHIKVVLYLNGREISVSYREFAIKYEELSSGFLSQRASSKKTIPATQVPAITDRHIQNYSGIQNQFPANYGINFRGVPASASKQRKAQALQLKAYLALFEQVILNQVGKIDEIKSLFSPLKFDNSYRSFLCLDDTIIPEFNKIKKDDYKLQLTRQNKEFDSFNRRINKVLDYLLALYGEKFKQNSIKQFNCYRSAKSMQIHIIENKTRLLKHIVAVTKDRIKASNLATQIWQKENISGLQLKSSILLDFDILACHSLSSVSNEDGIYHSSGFSQDEQQFSALSFDHKSIEDFFQTVSYQEMSDVKGDDLCTFFHNKFLDQEKQSIQSFLQSVVDINNFKVGRCPGTKKSASMDRDEVEIIYLVYFNIQKKRYLPVAHFSDFKTAEKAANILKAYFTNIMMHSEGMHVIEHNLLSQYFAKCKTETTIEPEFFNCRLTVILPCWTTRTANKQFQKFAEETIALNCPAHLYPMFLWLDLQQMSQFEFHYRQWLLSFENKKNRGEAGLAMSNYLWKLHYAGEERADEF